MRGHHRAKRQRGAAALEFALVAPVLLLMMLGMIDFGLRLNAEAVVTNAARDGARVASLGGDSAQVIAAAQKSSYPSATVKVDCLLLTDLATACDGGATYDVARADKKTTSNVARVTVTYHYSYITPLPAWIGFSSTANIQKVSYMRIEGIS
jgi:Flp pilus assembly protein TadG